MAIKGKNNFYYKRSDEIEIGEFGVNHKGEIDEIISLIPIQIYLKIIWI